MNLILLGPPGAGKGTQAKSLCDKFNLCHLSTGDILRNEVTEHTDLGKQAKSVMDKGELVSNNIILEIIKKFVNENLSKYSGFLFDGFPRSAEQADMLDTILDDMYHISHETLECGTGFYDMKNKHQKESRFILPSVIKYGPVPCGKVNGSVVYAPLGDLHAAVLGIDQDLEIEDVIINLGTGSQVIQINKTYRSDTENRPCFDYILNCITHIPSGRSMKFFKDLFDLPEYSTLLFEDVVKSTEFINLGYFKSAYNFNNGGIIETINESTTKYTIACSLLRCYVQQYVNILNLKFKTRSKIFLTGGIAKNIPTIKRLFEYYLNESVTVEDNDTLKGLYKYSKYDDTCFWFNR